MFRYRLRRFTLALAFALFFPFTLMSNALGMSGALADDRNGLANAIANTIKSTEAFGKVTILGDKRIDGRVFIILGDVLEIAIIADGLACSFHLEKGAEEIEFPCLDGDVFTGDVADTDDGARLRGKFAKRGKAKIVVSAVDRSTFKSAMAKLDNTEYNFIYPLTVVSEIEPENSTAVAEEKVEETVAQTDAVDENRLTTLIEQSKQTCIELGFSEDSNNLAKCTLKLLERSL